MGLKEGDSVVVHEAEKTIDYSGEKPRVVEALGGRAGKVVSVSPSFCDVILDDETKPRTIRVEHLLRGKS